MIPVRRYSLTYTWYSSPIAHLPYEIDLETLFLSAFVIFFTLCTFLRKKQRANNLGLQLIHNLV